MDSGPVQTCCHFGDRLKAREKRLEFECDTFGCDVPVSSWTADVTEEVTMLISRRVVIAAIGSAPAAAVFPLSAASPGATVTRRELHVLTQDGVEIRVRELRPDTRAEGGPIVLLHGARVPGIASFDLAVPNGSLAADLALRSNRTVYVMDARGYGGSARPPAMDRPPGENRPLSRAYEVVRDVDAVVKIATQRAGSTRAVLFGWATGGAWAAYYASLWPERVSHLITLNALYGATTPHPTLGPHSDTADPDHPDRLNPAIGAYALSSGESLVKWWDRSIPETDKSLWRDPAIASAYVDGALASDPESGRHHPAALRAPLGAIEDSFYQADGRRLYDASSITANALVIRSGRDFWSRPEDATSFIHDAVRARSTRVVTIPDATHFVHLDRPQRGRDQLVQEVIRLLSGTPSEA
jgi:pimeloyl-ACP methyl ester carboxylesterase